MTTKLINGDCLEEMKKLENNSIDLLFTDLPYTTAKTKCTSCSWDKPIDLEKFWIEVNRICKINCPMFFCCNTRFGVELINSNPKNYRYDFIWAKSRKSGFLTSGKMPLRSHEMVYVFYRKQPIYNVKKYHKPKFLKESNSIIDTKNEDKNLGNVFYGFDKDKFIDMRKQTGYEPPLPDSLLEIKSVGGKHQSQKPVDLISFFIKYYSNEGDTILDATMGSGSTGVACKELNRNFIGIELDEKIFKIAEERIGSSSKTSSISPLCKSS